MDFYTTLAQVLPVLLLTIVWDRDYLDELQSRSNNDVIFWTKCRVRYYCLTLTAAVVLGIATCLLVLVNTLGDALWLRLCLIGVAAMALVTLLVRISAKIVRATR